MKSSEPLRNFDNALSRLPSPTETWIPGMRVTNCTRISGRIVVAMTIPTWKVMRDSPSLRMRPISLVMRRICSTITRARS